MDPDISQAVFTPAQLQLVADFVEGLKAGGRRCLWLYGPRQSGTSTLARFAVECVYAADLPELAQYPTGRRIPGPRVESRVKALWKQQDLLSANGTDFAVWEEDVSLNKNWEYLWYKADVLFIDDLISPNAEFWNKHILVHLDQRVKSDRVTVIAGTTPPTAFSPIWADGFDALCVVKGLVVKGLVVKGLAPRGEG